MNRRTSWMGRVAREGEHACATVHVSPAVGPVVREPAPFVTR